MSDKQTINYDEIKMLVIDVDGVMTDGTIILDSNGNESKRFSILDGHGIKMWHRAGLETAIISGRESGATVARAKQLSISRVVQGQKKKLPAFEALLAETGFDASEVAYIGDDLLDLPLVVRAGLGVAVANAVQELKDGADMITAKTGGNGAVREVIELVLKETGKWPKLMERYLL